MASRITKLCSFINALEKEHGDLNDFFASIYDGLIDMSVTLKILYMYDCIDGLDIDFEEYDARYGEKSFEWQLERISVIAKEIYYVMRDSDEYKPIKGLVNRHKVTKWFK